jgi:hypothetical protein
MNKSLSLINEESIKDKIYNIRGYQVMLDRDLATLYGVKTKVFNQAVKRNINRFPSNFMFQLSKQEVVFLRSQIVTLENRRGKHRKYLPYVFTEHGVAMLSGVLKSDFAVNVSIKIIEEFVKMRKFFSINASIFNRLNSLEEKQFKTDTKLEKIFKAIEEKELKPKCGIFFNGEVFDSYVFISKLIKEAKKSIILIDNYVDESVLVLLSKRLKNVKALIYSKNITDKLKLDLKKYNKQYPKIKLLKFNKSHDRFLIIDEKIVYHIGASLKDLGKKWFAFSKLDISSLSVLEKL